MCILLRLVLLCCQELYMRYACNMDRSCAGIACLRVLGMAIFFLSGLVEAEQGGALVQLCRVAIVGPYALWTIMNAMSE